MRVACRRLFLSLAPIAGAALLAGCTPQAPVAAGSNRPVYSIDLSGGARQCTVNPFAINPGRESDANMTVGNDGGWCDIKVHQTGPEPYDAGLLTTEPAHGKVYIHQVGDDTRIDYTPDRGYVGPDSFRVTLLPGRPVIRVAVNVTR